MADITETDLERLAALAHVDLSEEEKPILARQLIDILNYAKCIQTVDTTRISPTSSSTSPSLPFRNDEPRTGPSRDDAAPKSAESEKGLIKIPRVKP